MIAVCNLTTAFSQTPPADGQGKPRRVALLLSNSAYPSVAQKLPSSGKNVEILRPALEKAGFRVTVAADFTLKRLLEEIEPQFLGQLRPGDVCVVFYSGYALQSRQDNYLVPVDFDPVRTADMDQRARSLTGLQQAIDAKGVGLKIIALDAPRLAPELQALASGLGLAQPDLTDTSEIVVGFSSGQGVLLEELQADRPGRFTEALAAAIQKPGLPLTEVFSTVQREVSVASGGRQVPFFLQKTTSEFNFLAPLPTVAVSVREPGKDELRPNRTDRQEYVLIPAATFTMGCVPGDKRCHPEEQPRHAVTITKGFWLGRTEVEINAYQRYVELDPKNRKMPAGPLWDKKWNITNHPITGVSWNNAKSYCEWAGGRLPTEAEWEYVARAGSSDEIYPLNDENSRDKANFAGTKKNDRFEATAPVRSFDANQFGLFDMAGNVWEWTQDWFDPNYFKESPAKDPLGPASGKEHTVRGGSHDSDPREHLRISYRQGFSKSSNTVGFRCALEDTPAVRKFLF